MTNNKKMSYIDKSKRQFKKVELALKDLSPENTQVYISKIRSIVLRDLCITYILALKEKKVLKCAEDIAAITGFSLRKSYDILNTIRFLSVADEKSTEGFLR